ncbi:MULTISPECIES: cysteine desulfurase CsdA [Proteus]|uniref:cysteine desulfurase CsdA n=1 Tax=Proteus TaxID=583 RepID=UPI0002FA8C53|nr:MULTISPECIES: cysteine desulfurase CsdA [Proteus]MBA7798151.1 cysteine desulfurase CsdA [Citrobacter sp. RHBSTW-01065]SSJ77828.1 cysteine sulfinate desulfinase [Klebsiella pneumoniae]ALE23148.1 cysteine sulfinate desulfinase [Proteus mirabilis]ALE26308.1 cysteine sulfinate desulfinase [Proteus mirabilis]AND11937.1 cysteine sulfinate desulfinase [Proteus mirabilis]
MKPFSPTVFRQQFPAIAENIVYLDSAATALKPVAMIEASDEFYRHSSATVHRSQYQQAKKMTQHFEQARQQVAQLLNLADSDTIIWTQGTTGSLNLIAQGYFRPRLQAGDEIIVSEQEHHANFIPWLMLAEQTGAKIIRWPIEDNFLPSIATLATLLTARTRVVAISQMSNITGAQIALDKVSQCVHQYDDCLLVVDGAQGIAHHATDISALDIDFYAFSAHKLYGPNGLGVCYGKRELLEVMSAWQGGGKMLTTASFNGFVPAAIPHRFEAGTPNIAAVIAFSATLDWLQTQDMAQANQYALTLADEAQARLEQLEGFISYRAPHSPVLAFNFEGIHHSDLAALIAEQGIALRTGQHCAQPLIDALTISGCLRASFMPYNQLSDIDRLVDAVKFALSLLKDED